MTEVLWRTHAYSQEDFDIKCVLLGDCYVGKSSLIFSYLRYGIPYKYVSTFIHKYYEIKRFNNKRMIKLEICDTCGKDYNLKHSLSDLSCSDPDVFVICFLLNSPTSFDNIARSWIPL